MKLHNDQGQEVYYNTVTKHGKVRHVIVAANPETVILGRDRQRKRSRTFAQEAQAEAWLRRMGYEPV